MILLSEMWSRTTRNLCHPSNIDFRKMEGSTELQEGSTELQVGLTELQHESHDFLFNLGSVAPASLSLLLQILIRACRSAIRNLNFRWMKRITRRIDRVTKDRPSYKGSTELQKIGFHEIRHVHSFNWVSLVQENNKKCSETEKNDWRVSIHAVALVATRTEGSTELHVVVRNINTW